MTNPKPTSRGRRIFLVGSACSISALASATLVDVVGGLLPSLVAIGTYRETDSPRFGFRGSGFVVGDGNTIVTNHHVLPPEPAGISPGSASRLMVLTPSLGAEAGLREAQLLRTDVAHDLALLRVKGDPLPSAALATGPMLPLGTAIALLGFPIGGLFGFSPVVHRGIVAAHTRIALPAPRAAQLNAATVSRLRQGPFQIYQLDATAYPGNSGGPLVDAVTGDVIGVVNMVMVRSTRESALSNPTGITYAIPISRVLDMLKA